MLLYLTATVVLSEFSNVTPTVMFSHLRASTTTMPEHGDSNTKSSKEKIPYPAEGVVRREVGARDSRAEGSDVDGYTLVGDEAASRLRGDVVLGGVREGHDLAGLVGRLGESVGVGVRALEAELA